jgi:hypothetical protein
VLRIDLRVNPPSTSALISVFLELPVPRATRAVGAQFCAFDHRHDATSKEAISEERGNSPLTVIVGRQKIAPSAVDDAVITRCSTTDALNS